MSEELKPCPFCGKPPKIMGGDFKGILLDPCSGSGPLRTNEWNNAWVWKEIDKARDEANSLRTENEDLRNRKTIFSPIDTELTIVGLEKQIDRLQAENVSLKLRYQELEEQTGKTGAERLRLRELCDELAGVLDRYASRDDIGHVPGVMDALKKYRRLQDDKDSHKSGEEK